MKKRLCFLGVMSVGLFVYAFEANAQAVFVTVNAKNQADEPSDVELIQQAGSSFSVLSLPFSYSSVAGAYQGEAGTIGGAAQTVGIVINNSFVNTDINYSISMTIFVGDTAETDCAAANNKQPCALSLSCPGIYPVCQGGQSNPFYYTVESGS